MSPDSLPARILLIDDHPAVRQGLRILLNSRRYQVNAEAEDRDQALVKLKDMEFDVALLDLTLQDGSGLELLPELIAHDISVVIYSMHEEPATISRAFSLGALGYVNKHEEPDTLFEAIDTVASGEKYMSPCTAQSLEEHQGKREYPEDILSDRERQIFTMIGMGIGNTEIAESLKISPRTVGTYFTRIVEKLKCENLRELRKLSISAVSQSLKLK